MGSHSDLAGRKPVYRPIDLSESLQWAHRRYIISSIPFQLTKRNQKQRECVLEVISYVVRKTSALFTHHHTFIEAFRVSRYQYFLIHSV